MTSALQVEMQPRIFDVLYPFSNSRLLRRILPRIHHEFGTGAGKSYLRSLPLRIHRINSWPRAEGGFAQNLQGTVKMSVHHSPKALTSHQAAIEMIPSDPKQVGEFFSKMFQARDSEAEQRARIREEFKAREYEDAIQEQLGIEKNCMKAVKFWREEFRKNRYKASKGFAQMMYVAQLEGFTEPVEAPEDETPVMDRTKTAKRMSSFAPTRDGSRPSYGAIQSNMRQREVEAAYADCLEKLHAGVPVNRLREGQGRGRPPASWNEGFSMAVAQFERETGRSLAHEGEDQAAAE